MLDSQVCAVGLVVRVPVPVPAPSVSKVAGELRLVVRVPVPAPSVSKIAGELRIYSACIQFQIEHMHFSQIRGADSKFMSLGERERALYIRGERDVGGPEAG